jgi:uncharacterized protein (DUF1778 family)
MMLTTQENPLTLRMSAHEKAVLNSVARQLNTSRHKFMRMAVLDLAAEMQAENLVEV